MPAGRPTDYRDEFVDQARKLCEMGATDEDLAHFFDVHVATIYRWKLQHQEFCEAVKIPKEIADDRVEMSLYRRALGYTFDSEKVFQHQGEIVRAATKEHVPPDPTSMIFWLKNRRREKWMDVNRNEQTGANGGPIRVEGEHLAELRRRFLRASERGEDGSGPGDNQ